MKYEEIDKLFRENARLVFESDDDQYMDVYEFARALKQAELIWYSKLEKKLGRLFEFKIVELPNDDIAHKTYEYYLEIKKKVEKLKDEN